MVTRALAIRVRPAFLFLLAPLLLAADDPGAAVRVLSVEAGELGCWLELEELESAEEGVRSRSFAVLAGPQLCDPDRRGGSLEGKHLQVTWRQVEWPTCLECEQRMVVRQLTDMGSLPAQKGSGGCRTGG